MEDWIVVGRYPEYNDEARAEQERWELVAEDVALYPVMNVRLAKEENGVRIEVSKDLYTFFQGTPGSF